jgi:hypothetical protein
VTKLKQLLDKCTGFEWDHGNETKNWDTREVTIGECEQVFFNKPLNVTRDKKHSDFEARYFALGKTLYLPSGTIKSMLEDLKILANKRDVPYQFLLKIFLSERINSELHQ